MTITAKEYRAMLADTDEHELQSQVIAWAHSEASPGPLISLYANVNGQYRRGQRMEPGLSAGVPDLFLPVPRSRFHGLYMELKVELNDLTESQYRWLHYLDRQGYAVTTCWTLATAKAALIEYVTDPGAFVSGL